MLFESERSLAMVVMKCIADMKDRFCTAFTGDEV